MRFDTTDVRFDRHAIAVHHVDALLIAQTKWIRRTLVRFTFPPETASGMSEADGQLLLAK